TMDGNVDPDTRLHHAIPIATYLPPAPPPAAKGGPAPATAPAATAEEKPAAAQPTPQPAKTDRERMAGNWFITNEDSQRKGEMWVITEDSILMYANYG